MENFGANLAAEISAHFDKKTAIVEELSEALYLSKDAIYRRLRGETSFTFEEACTIANKLGLSLDAIAKSNGQEKVAFCSYSLYESTNNSFKTFLQDILTRVQKITPLPDVQLYYSTKGLPLFLYLQYPELLAFKLFVWEVASWNANSIHEEKFDFDILTAEDVALANQAYGLYCNIPSHEIWNTAILDSSFAQIQYLKAIGLFKDKSVVERLFQNLRDVMNAAKEMAGKGHKIYNGEEKAVFNLYQSELFNATNNVIYVESAQRSFVTWTFCDPDTLSSFDENLCRRASTWLQSLIQQSNNITKQSLRIRNEYFNGLEAKIDAAITAI